MKSVVAHICRICSTIAAALIVTVALAAFPSVHAASGTAHCADPKEVYVIADGRDYRGFINVTETGIPCQRWTSQTPHAHDTDVVSGAGGVGNHNYCRNPMGLARPWCFTMDPLTPLQYCAVGDPCPLKPDPLSVHATPATGTHFPERSTAVVTLSCFPRPCDIYYTLNGTVPEPPTRGLRYTDALQLTTNTTLKYAALFGSGKVQHGVARYSVAAAAPPSSNARFIPTDAIVYRAPVLIFVEGLVSGRDTAVYYVNNIFRGVYTQAFWLNESATVVAVVNGRDVVRANYTIRAIAPAIALYPPPGTYTGGVSIAVYPTSTEAASFYHSFNGTRPWTAMETMRLVLMTTGATDVAVQAVYLGGLTSYAGGIYTITPATSPTLHPSPLRAYTRPVDIICTDPTGAGLPVRLVSSEDVAESEGEEKPEYEDDDSSARYHIKLREPGSYTVRCDYTDDMRVHHKTTATFMLLAAPLPAPHFLPACGTVFPQTPLVLRTEAVGPEDNDLVYNGSTSRLNLSISLAGGADALALAQVVRTGGPEEARYAYWLVPRAEVPLLAPGTAAVAVDVQLIASSLDPMEADSDTVHCSYEVMPLGPTRTADAVARPMPTLSADCVPSADGELGPSCALQLSMQLATCLSFASTELIAATSVGPFVVFSVGGLDARILGTYESRMLACLRDPTEVSVEPPVLWAADGDVALATGWRLLSGPGAELVNGTDPHVMAPANGAAIEVAGYGVVLAQDYRFVRAEYGCDDIGFAARNFPPPPEDKDMELYVADDDQPSAHDTGTENRTVAGVNPLWSRLGTRALGLNSQHRGIGLDFASGRGVAGTQGDSTYVLVFLLETPGLYKLCAKLDNVTYALPSRVLGVSDTLTVVPHAWPSVQPATGSTCGGLVDAAHSETPLAISFTTTPAELLLFYAFSVNLGDWYLARQGTSIPVPSPVDSYSHPTAVVSATASFALAVAPAVCVFYAPAVNPAIVTTGLNYSFYTLGNRTDAVPPAVGGLDADGSGSSPSFFSFSSLPASSSASGSEVASTPPPHRPVDVSGVAEVVLALRGTFQAGERILIEVFETNATDGVSGDSAANQTALRLVASTLATSPTGANRTLAAPDATVWLPFGRSNAPFVVRATLDGGAAVSPAATQVVLSPLAVAMTACPTCASGYCYGPDACVCVGQTNRTAYICNEGPRPVKPEVPKTPMHQRLLLLAFYFGFLALTAAAFLWMVKKNEAARKHDQGRAVDITVEAEAADVPPARREG